MKEKRPHIIIFNPDQMRADALRHLGNKASYTPNLDNFTEDAMSFRNAFAQNPVCTPSRCSFMSGLYPHVNGHRTISYMMHKEEPVLLKELKDEGYHVWINGRNDLVPAEGRNPYKEYANTVFTPKKKLEAGIKEENELENKMRSYKYSHYHGTLIPKSNSKDIYDIDTSWVEGAVDFLKNRPKNKPLCMFLPVMYPHPPYQSDKKYMDLIDDSKLTDRVKAPESWSAKPSMLKGLSERQGLADWSEEMWTHLRKTYLAMCARVDALFGMLIEALKEEGLYDDSAIFFFSDHGDFSGDYGLVEKNQNTFEECLINVPFLVKLPKWMNGNNGINYQLVELIDFYATVEDITGMQPTHTHFGKSLKSVLTGTDNTHRKFVFCEGGRLSKEIHCSEGYHYPQLVTENNEYYPRISLQVSEGPYHTKAAMIRSCEYKYVRRLDEKDEFYDINKDPGNLHNLIDDEFYNDIIKDMKDKLMDWMQGTADIVPFKEDSRLDTNMLMIMLKARLSIWKFAIFKLMVWIKGGIHINKIMR